MNLIVAHKGGPCRLQTYFQNLNFNNINPLQTQLAECYPFGRAIFSGCRYVQRFSKMSITSSLSHVTAGKSTTNQCRGKCKQRSATAGPIHTLENFFLKTTEIFPAFKSVTYFHILCNLQMDAVLASAFLR